ncbi:MAG: hypothetical protein KAZ28_02790 [Bacteroidaceae bacterium]|nr:hypothetical protein [Bacteroidaceae bacterium]
MRIIKSSKTNYRARMFLLLIVLAIFGSSVMAQSVIVAPTRPTTKTAPAKKVAPKKKTSPAKTSKVKSISHVTSGLTIDLGLSVKWASHNVGANSPEEYGGYYAWGETEEKSKYTEDTYKWYNNGSYTDIGSEISGTEYDVAHVKWGGNWRIPSKEEIRELVENCRCEKVTYKGVKGSKFISKKNGNSIFLPAAGARYGTKVDYSGTNGNYWSGTLYPDGSNNAYDLYCNGYHAHWNVYDRYIGFSVRPVSD